MSGLSSDLEGNVVGGVALELEGRGGLVVEVLVDELDNAQNISTSFNGWVLGSHCPQRKCPKPLQRLRKKEDHEMPLVFHASSLFCWGGILNKGTGGRSAYVVSLLGDIGEVGDGHCEGIKGRLQVD